jgi:Flp pilus assembly protein TadG
VLSLNRTTRRIYSRVRGRAKGRTRLGEAGQALVEVAIALPILLALLVGIFEFARAYNVQQVITNAAREGARQGVLPTMGQADAVTRANARLSDANISSATVTFTCSSPCTTGAEVGVTIEVPYTFVFIGPVLSLLASGDHDPGTINLSSTATMRKE